MIKFFGPAQDQQGNILLGFTARVLKGDGSAHPIYADSGGTNFPTANVAEVDANGMVEFYYDPEDDLNYQLLNTAGSIVNEIRDFASEQANASNKAAAAAIGVSPTAANLGTFTSPLIDDNVTAKSAIESIGTNLAAATGTSRVGHKGNLPNMVAAPAYVKMLDLVSVRDYDSTAGEGGNDQPAIQQMFTDIASVGKGVAFLPRPEVSWKINSGLVLDYAKCGFRSDGGLIDASGMTSGTAFKVQGSVSPPFFQAHNSIERLQLVGPGSTSNVDGLVFDSDGIGGASSHLACYSGAAYYFRRGISFLNHAYLITTYSFDVFGCGYGIYAPAGTTDSGENVRMVAGAIYGCSRPVYVANPSMDMYFDGTSIDYHETANPIFEVADARLFFSGHFEDASYDAIPFKVSGNGAMITFDRVRMFNRDGPAHAMTHMFDIGENASVVLGVVNGHNMLTTSKQWYTGDGDFQIVGRVNSYETAGLPTIPNVNKGRMLDPQFAAASVLDNVWISEGGTITDRLNSSNGTVSIDTGRLKFAKSAGVGQPFTINIAVPCTGQEAIGALLAYSKAAGMATSAPVFLNMYYASLRDGDIPEVMKTATFASEELEFGSGAISSTDLSFQGNTNTRAEGWANWAVVTVSLGGASSGDFFLDFLQMDRTA